jgi:hypothetical protein
MKLSRILLVLAFVLLIASNGFSIYQNNKNKSKIDELQTTMIKTQKGLLIIDGDIQNTNTNVQYLCSKLEAC